jgi:alkanesulfonate monooxygenase SsuD/methylene tetrahydromethanopterin reductase-like flavin-dependent oxidoreductase (luciferase family)
VRIGLVILPTDRWKDARRQWEWADGVGFATAWTYDHIRWGGMPDGPWLAAIPVLAAAAAVTKRIRLGTLVATPNFRHPVVLARDVIALDDLSNGRFDLGVGPGTEGPDAQALGQDPWSLAERMDRYGEFVQTLRQVLDGDAATRTTISGRHYAATNAPSTPGTVQTPFPLTIAAGGPRGPQATLATRSGVRHGGPGSGQPGQGGAVDAHRSGHHVTRPIRSAGRSLRGDGNRPAGPAPPGTDRPLRRGRPRL